MDIGLLVTQLVLSAATILVNPAAPGYVVLGLVLIFGVAAILYWRRVTRQTEALSWLTGIVSEPKDAVDFTAKIIDLTHTRARNWNISSKTSAKRSWLRASITSIIVFLHCFSQCNKVNNAKIK